MPSGLASLLVAFAGYSLKTVSQATQRIALQRLKDQNGDDGAKATLSRRLPAILLWVAATAGTTSSVIVLFAAISLGHVSTVGAMAGSGLITLAIFSHFASKERVGLREMICISIIIVSLAFIGLFDRPNQDSTPLLNALILSLVVLVVVYGSTSIVFRKKPAIAGSLLGGLAGAVAGYVALFQKLALSRPGVDIPSTITWVLLSVAGLGIMQLALIRCRAIRAVPIFYANSMAVPVVGGVLFFGDVLHPLQWIGIVSMIAPVMFMTAARPRNVPNRRPVAGPIRQDRTDAVSSGS